MKQAAITPLVSVDDNHVICGNDNGQLELVPRSVVDALDVSLLSRARALRVSPKSTAVIILMEAPEPRDLLDFEEHSITLHALPIELYQVRCGFHDSPLTWAVQDGPVSQIPDPRSMYDPEWVRVTDREKREDFALAFAPLALSRVEYDASRQRYRVEAYGIAHNRVWAAQQDIEAAFWQEPHVRGIIAAGLLRQVDEMLSQGPPSDSAS